MNVAGPSLPHPVSGARERDNYEEDLTRIMMIAPLDLTDIEKLQAVYDRKQGGHGHSDREVAFSLLIQGAGELADFNHVDQTLAWQRLAVDRAEEPDPAPRAEKRVQSVIAPQPTIRDDILLGTRTWRKRVTSFFSITAPSTPIALNPNQAPTTTAGAPPIPTGHDCVICQDPIFEVEIRAPCGHFYDISCITNLFQFAAYDESLYPPRCCLQIIPLRRVRPHLMHALITEFKSKAQECRTRNRVYCASPACSRFLGPLYKGFFRKVFTCPSTTCTMATCGKCRGRYDGRTHNCAPDAETEQVLTLSRVTGWSRCPGCSQMVELDMGCYHMTCRCKTEFCYLCSARWKTCKCPKWDENNLLSDAVRDLDA